MSDRDSDSVAAGQGDGGGDDRSHSPLQDEIEEERDRYNEARFSGLTEQVSDLQRQLEFHKEKDKSFKKKGHEKQYKFNCTLLQKASVTKEYINKARKTKATAALEEMEALIKKRNKDIRIADRSEYGWLTVEEYNSDDLAEDSDDAKTIKSAEKRAKQKKEQQAGERRGTGRRNRQDFRYHPYAMAAPGNSGFIARERGGSSTITRPPTDAINTAGNSYGQTSRIRSGYNAGDDRTGGNGQERRVTFDFNNRGRGRGGGAVGSNIQCWRCGVEGHYRNQCPEQQG